MRNVFALKHNEFVDVVPTFLLYFKFFEVELMLPPMFMNLY